MRLGLVADLHGRFDPLLPKVLAGVDRILLAGDIVEDELLGRLASLAPLDAVRGNNDTSPAYPANYAGDNVIAVAATDRFYRLVTPRQP